MSLLGKLRPWLTRPERCRFCRLYVMSLFGFAAAFSWLTTLMFMMSSGPNRQRYASQFLFHDGIRSTAPAACGSALVLALVLWAHPFSAERVQSRLSSTLSRALAAALPGYLVAVLVVGVAGLLLLFRDFEQGFGIVSFGLGIVSWRDFWVGGRFVVLDTLLIVFMARRYLTRLQVGRTSLAEKLVVVVTVSVGLRASLAALVSWFFE